VVTNLVVSEIRRQRVRRETPGPAAVANSVDPVASRLAGLDLRSAFARTSRADLACLTLYAAGYSHREMAEILGGPVHRIGPRVARALGRLRRELARKIGSDSHPGGLRSDRYRQGPSDV
jgi:DNA-directed RNA polymerase specialized sigma24 family protein